MKSWSKVLLTILVVMVLLIPYSASAGLFRHGGRYGGGGSENEGNFRQADPIGRYGAVVRIECVTNSGGWKLGSGVVVQWGSSIRILTCVHVISETTQIKIRVVPTGVRYAATVLAQSDWDCAVLGVSEEIVGVEPAYLSTEAEVAAMKTDQLESCGFGSRGNFAINVGHFLGYANKDYEDTEFNDWMRIDGSARQGDSGGPIFNAAGNVVGILRATDGRIVIGVQAGRLGKTLNESIGQE